MSVNIHGRQYITVAERVQEVHADRANDELLSINTELLPVVGQVVIKATVKTHKGTFTGISAANPAKPIEKMSPYEVAETSAVGRALGFAGYGIIDGIATADEMVKAEDRTFEEVPGVTLTKGCPECHATGKYHKPGCTHA